MSFNQIPKDVFSLRLQREQANKSEAMIVTNINRNSKLLVDLVGTIDFDSIEYPQEVFPELYNGYTQMVGLQTVIRVAQEIINDPSCHNMHIVNTKGKILLDKTLPYPDEFAVPFWMGLSHDEFIDVLEYIHAQAQEHGITSPDVNKKNEELETLSQSLRDLGEKFTSGEMDLVEYMRKSNPVVKQINTLRNEISAIQKVQS